MSVRGGVICKKELCGVKYVSVEITPETNRAKRTSDALHLPHQCRNRAHCVECIVVEKSRNLTIEDNGDCVLY